MESAIRSRCRSLVTDRTLIESGVRVQRDVNLVQIMSHIKIITPDYCGKSTIDLNSNGSITTDAAMNVGGTVGALQAVDIDPLIEEAIAAVQTIIHNHPQGDPTADFQLSEASRVHVPSSWYSQYTY